MARDFQINGPTLVKVKGGLHLRGVFSGNAAVELGLTSDQVRVTPRFYHTDIHADDFGKEAPAEVLWEAPEYAVRMTLIHYDQFVLDVCTSEAMGGFSGTATFPGNALMGAGSLMGNGFPVLASGNHYLNLILTSPNAADPRTFQACYLAEHPYELPLGAGASHVQLNWRCVPYRPPPYQPATSGGSGANFEIQSSGLAVVLQDLTQIT